MLYHHSNQSYDHLAPAAAAAARDKMQAVINGGAASITALFEQLKVPQDFVVGASALDFDVENGVPSMSFSDQAYEIHDHAFKQACSRVELPLRYASALKRAAHDEEWASALLAHNLNELYGARGKRYLVRTVDGEVRGFLSDRYRRLDSGPIFQAFGEACRQFGAVAVRGQYTPTKFAVKMMLPTIFEPVENEPLCVGLHLRNSDFGDGALAIQLFVLRLWCTNYATAEDLLNQVHLGRRLPDDVAFSQRTYELDTQTMVSAVSDVVQASLAPPRVNRILEGVKAAHEQEIDPLQVGKFLKKYLTKSQAKVVVEKFSSADVVSLPPGQNVWRLSNALSWFAGEVEVEDPGKAMELEKAAGDALLLVNNAKLKELDAGFKRAAAAFLASAPPQPQQSLLTPAAAPVKPNGAANTNGEVSGRFAGLELD